MNWFWEADAISCDVFPKRLYLINRNKISFHYNRPTEFYQGHSAVLEMKHANRWIVHAHYTFFSWTSRVLNSEIMYKLQVTQN
jgi:hypothetical protein